MNIAYLLTLLSFTSTIIQGTPCEISKFVTGVGALGGFNAAGGVSALGALFKFTCDLNNSWSPISFPNKHFQVPDQIEISSVAIETEALAYDYYKQYSDFQTMYESGKEFSVGFEIPGSFKAAFNYDEELGNARQMLQGGTSTQAYSTHRWYLYQLSLPPAYVLEQDDEFILSWKALPPNITTPHDENMYSQLIDGYGTHRPVRVIMGGMADLNSFIANSFFESKTESYMSQQVGLSFHKQNFGFSAGGFSDWSDIHIDEEFVFNANAFGCYKGGDPSLTHNYTTQQKWVQSLELVPSVMNITLRGLWELIPDDEISATLEAYIRNYVENSGANTSKWKGIKDSSVQCTPVVL